MNDRDENRLEQDVTDLPAAAEASCASDALPSQPDGTPPVTQETDEQPTETAQQSVEPQPIPEEPKPPKPRKRRWGLKIVAMVLAALLIGSATTACHFLVARYFGNVVSGFLNEEETTDEETTGGEDESKPTEGDSEHPNTSPGLSGLPDATINKRQPQRIDENGDGKADPAFNANGQILTSAGDEVYSVATVCNKVLDSVVEIRTSSSASSTLQSGAGSGVIIAKEGYIITNNHVIEGASTISVRLTDGSIYTAKLVGRDERTDIAVIWIDPGDKQLSVATLGASYDLVVGEPVLACGNPLGSLGGTMTEGIISATERSINVEGTTMTLLQVSAPINPGNSGGGLFNMAGHLVGVVNAKYAAEGVEGLGFAIPVDTAYDIAMQLIRTGSVAGRPGLGITLKETDEGLVVHRSNNDAFQSGDRLVSINGHKMMTLADAQRALSGLSVGDEVDAVVIRDGKEISFKVTLIEIH